MKEAMTNSMVKINRRNLFMEGISLGYENEKSLKISRAKIK
jgi:hypothetical protein